jgi:release factor glutamine methyltransferase
MKMLDRREKELLAEVFSGKELDDAIKSVENGTPLAYALGQWYFYGLTFKLNRDCLIPRPDTEHIVEKAIETVNKNGTFADLCTGSGCIAISLKKHRQDLYGYALDVSKGALEMARENAELNGTPLTFIEADLLSCNPQELFPMLDAVISNPPYIKSEVVKTLEVAKTEPTLALDGGDDGMIFYRRILDAFTPILKKDGVFIFEIGYDQRTDIESLAREHGFKCAVYKDYGGNYRVAVLKR